MPRPLLNSYKLFVRLSDQAATAIRRQAAENGIEARELVEQVVGRYLTSRMDGLKPLHQYAAPEGLGLRTYKVSRALGERLERVHRERRFTIQEIVRAAITDHLHIL